VSGPSGILPRLWTSARGWLEAPREQLNATERALRIAIHVVGSCVRKLGRDRAPQIAAALSFQTLFSLLPLLVVALIVLHSVRGLENAGSKLRTAIVEFLVPESLIDPERDLVGPPNPQARATVEEFNDARSVLRVRGDQVLESLSGVSFAGIGAAGFLLFLYGATALMRTVENSFNLIYQADSPRPWSRLPLYFMLLTLGPVALVAAQVLQDRLLQNIGWMGGWLTARLAFVAPLVVTCAILVLAFRSIPNTWVSWRAAAIGGFWSGIAWYAFQEIFGAYVTRASMTSLYGALALVPLFLLWIYWSWLIILAGLTLSFAVQYVASGETWFRQPSLPGDPHWLVPVMLRIAQSFDHSEPLSMPRLSRELQLPPRIVRPYLKLLERTGFVRRFRDRGGEHVYTLGKPMSSIKVADLLSLVAPETSTTGALDSDLLRELHRSQLDVVRDLTLDQLARPPAATGEPAPARVPLQPAADRGQR
jgi:uncharacterized BrkB/YihY/UPF0761 family membrane protein/DNA-binding IscR family transcriptional regulator